VDSNDPHQEDLSARPEPARFTHLLTNILVRGRSALFAKALTAYRDAASATSTRDEATTAHIFSGTTSRALSLTVIHVVYGTPQLSR